MINEGSVSIDERNQPIGDCHEIMGSTKTFEQDKLAWYLIQIYEVEVYVVC